MRINLTERNEQNWINDDIAFRETRDLRGVASPHGPIESGRGFLPQASQRFLESSQRSRILPDDGMWRRGFFSSPSADRVIETVSGANMSPAQPPASQVRLPQSGGRLGSPLRTHGAALSPVGSTSDRPQVPGTCGTPPYLFAVFLFGPCAGLLQELVERLAPYLDQESGDLLHWVVLGSPRRSGDIFRSFLERSCPSLAELDAEWVHALADRADSVNAVEVETLRLASRLKLGVEDLPALVLIRIGQNDEPLCIRLPKAATINVDCAWGVLSILRHNLDAKLLAKLIGAERPSVVQQASVVQKQAAQIIHELGRKVDGPGSRPMTNEAKKLAAVGLVSQGRKINAAAKEAGISRQALDKDPKIKRMLRRARAQHGSGIEASRPGSKVDGRIEALNELGDPRPDDDDQ